eukprot:9689012-Alexandrium_andersonii.AAC.1
MSASLVGSEMCIRDSLSTRLFGAARALPTNYQAPPSRRKALPSTIKHAQARCFAPPCVQNASGPKHGHAQARLKTSATREP